METDSLVEYESADEDEIEPLKKIYVESLVISLIPGVLTHWTVMIYSKINEVPKEVLDDFWISTSTITRLFIDILSSLAVFHDSLDFESITLLRTICASIMGIPIIMGIFSISHLPQINEIIERDKDRQIDVFPFIFIAYSMYLFITGILWLTYNRILKIKLNMIITRII
ncbi:uncharacterized protein LOC130675725 [Microplitis mediator]|uniref:uncharacterized protein LOC130675725 n=1 Tax=Microplitis mediator TaxID=375433 RepID=UPI002553FD2F|nr:uncharacterized protein LOC130675725 [Microplitis mediator]